MFNQYEKVRKRISDLKEKRNSVRESESLTEMPETKVKEEGRKGMKN